MSKWETMMEGTGSEGNLPRHKCRPQPSTKILINTEGKGEFVSCVCQEIANLACRCGWGAKREEPRWRLLSWGLVQILGFLASTLFFIVGSSHPLSTNHAVLQAELVLRTSTSTNILKYSLSTSIKEQTTKRRQPLGSLIQRKAPARNRFLLI